MSHSQTATGSANENRSAKAEVIYKIALGRCSVAILQYRASKQADSKPFAIVQRSYQKNGQWVDDSIALPVDDLGNLSAAAYEAYVAAKAK